MFVLSHKEEMVVQVEFQSLIDGVKCKLCKWQCSTTTKKPSENLTTANLLCIFSTCFFLLVKSNNEYICVCNHCNGVRCRSNIVSSITFEINQTY